MSEYLFYLALIAPWAGFALWLNARAEARHAELLKVLEARRILEELNAAYVTDKQDGAAHG